MSAFDSVAEAEARAELAVAQGGLGEQLQFVHEGAAAVPIWVREVSADSARIAEGLQVANERVSVFRVATGQTGFSRPTNDTEPVCEGDEFSRNSRVYVVRGIGKNVGKSVYTLACVQRKTKNFGGT